MKNKLTFALSFLVIITINAACRKKCCDIPAGATFIQAQKDSKEWSSTPEVAAIYQDTLYLFGRAKEETLVMKIKFAGVGKYVLGPQQAMYYVTIGGDVFLARYYGDNTAAESAINITSYDAQNKMISGNFNMNLSRAYAYTPVDSSFPQKTAFTGGTFKIQLAK